MQEIPQETPLNWKCLYKDVSPTVRLCVIEFYQGALHYTLTLPPDGFEEVAKAMLDCASQAKTNLQLGIGAIGSISANAEVIPADQIRKDGKR